MLDLFRKVDKYYSDKHGEKEKYNIPRGWCLYYVGIDILKYVKIILMLLKNLSSSV